MNYCKYIMCLCAVLICTACSTANEKVLYEMTDRLFPEKANKFKFEEREDKGGDYYEIEAVKGKIVIRGNNANSMAVGLNNYLKNFCNTSVSWYADDVVELPETLPLPEKKITAEARCKNRFFLNYCTFGYTMPWWQWRDWERLIDWMALNGINMPLAITGQEAVWYKVWQKMGLTDDQIRNYFTGPAHLPWHRMSNLDYWQGPLPKEWLDGQEKLQQQIVKRERQFNMRPILPAFAGHVPAELKTLYPDAKISQMSSWGGFKDKYRSHFLDANDPLFAQIQKAFLSEQTELFGTDNIYGTDPFNEVEPPSWEPDFLATTSKHIYKSITDVDPDATWLQMTWLFYIDRHKWTNDRVKAFLHGVPQDKMLLLDYYCENTEVWKQTERYFGQPYLWCYLGNFGGNTMLSGNIKEVGERIENVYRNGGKNMWGLGSTLEGFDVNPFMYEYVFDKAWKNNLTDSDWMARWADTRAGKKDGNVRDAWKLLYDSVYIAPAQLGQGTLTNARPTLEGSGNWTTNPAYNYMNKTLFVAWEKMLSATGVQKESYSYDVANLGRQVLGNHFKTLRDQFTQAYTQKDIASLQEKGQRMKELLVDIEKLLATQRTFLVGKWIADARSLGVTPEQKDYYEENARNIVSTWGDKSQSLNDYANRTWAGLVSGYYAPRWNLFIDQVITSAKNGTPFQAEEFYKQVTQNEYDWMKAKDNYISQPVGNSVEIAIALKDKYKSEIIK